MKRLELKPQGGERGEAVCEVEERSVCWQAGGEGWCLSRRQGVADVRGESAHSAARGQVPSGLIGRCHDVMAV